MRRLQFAFGVHHGLTGPVVACDGSVGLYAQNALGVRGITNMNATRTDTGANKNIDLTTSLNLTAVGEQGKTTLTQLLGCVDDYNGAVRIQCDQWERQANICSITVDTITPRTITVTATIEYATQYWHTTGSPIPLRQTRATNSEGADYPYDYPHDYLTTGTSLEWTDSEHATQCLAGLVFYGPANNPTVTIDSNTYEITATLDKDSTVTVDPLTYSVTRNTIGQQTDIFAKALRAAGPGSGSYIFQPLTCGHHTVTWDGSYDIDITPIYLKRWLW